MSPPLWLSTAVRKHLVLVVPEQQVTDFRCTAVTEAIWDALLAHGERWQRIGQTFYDDTDEGQPVLVIPLEPA